MTNTPAGPMGTLSMPPQPTLSKPKEPQPLPAKQQQRRTACTAHSASATWRPGIRFTRWNVFAGRRFSRVSVAAVCIVRRKLDPMRKHLFTLVAQPVPVGVLLGGIRHVRAVVAAVTHPILIAVAAATIQGAFDGIAQG